MLRSKGVGGTRFVAIGHKTWSGKSDRIWALRSY